MKLVLPGGGRLGKFNEVIMAREGFAPHDKESMDSVSEMNGGSLKCSHGERKEVLAFLLPCRVPLQRISRTSFRRLRAFVCGPLRMGLVFVTGVWKQYEKVQMSRTFCHRSRQLSGSRIL